MSMPIFPVEDFHCTLVASWLAKQQMSTCASICKEVFVHGSSFYRKTAIWILTLFLYWTETAAYSKWNLYCIAGKFGKFNLANCPWFAKLKSSKLVLAINNLLVDLLICQTFFHQMLKKSQFIKFYPLPKFPTISISLTCLNSIQKRSQYLHI